MKEMSKQVGPKVKQLWNVAMHVRHNFLGVVINTTAYHLGRYSLHHFLLKSSMGLHIVHYSRRGYETALSPIPTILRCWYLLSAKVLSSKRSYWPAR